MNTGTEFRPHLRPSSGLVLICFSFLTTLGISQGDSTQRDTTYLVPYLDKIIVKANLETQTDEYQYLNEDDGTRLHLIPNNVYRLFLSLDYEFLGVSVGVVPKFLGANSDEGLKGESSFTDYRFRFFLGKWVQALEYSKVSGYYVKNMGDFAPDWTEGTDPYLQFSNLTSSKYGMSTSYVFNPNFSYRNIVYQNEWQKKSSGSFVATLFYDYNTFTFNELDIDSKERFFNIRLAPSYYYTYVLHENWFVSGNLSPSLGIRFSQNTTLDGTVTDIDTDSYFTRSISTGLNLGYSSKKVIFGANLTFNSSWYNEGQNSRTENDQFYGVLYVGYRFEPPTLVKKLFKPFTGN
ncbi:DUF4421 family protein [Flagellimonas iocasae]|uniref:DUF4421 family protein n=1 Tax=Flagellimonas iocasae TaxID=2055905 RepID=A0ABW4XUB5_9FLAO